jgi:uncharacterized protein
MNESAATKNPPETYDNRRDWHLFSKGPKKLLALDGGGVRGAATVAFLERIEDIICAETRGALPAPDAPPPPPGLKPIPPGKIRLGDWFDLVGGTSTGAIIAGAIALGHTTAEIKDFYLHLAPKVFKRAPWRIPFVQAKFDARALAAEITGIIKDRTLDSPDLITGLAIISKRLDTGSAWIVANNKNAPYWNDHPAHNYIGNRNYRLANLVRASTAAPHYFDPEILPILDEGPDDPLGALHPNLTQMPALSFLLSKIRAQYHVLRGTDTRQDRQGLFVDGGVTPFNNPSLALLMMAALKPFGINWDLGPNNLTMMSIGTGTYRTKLTFRNVALRGPLGVAIGALVSLMGDTEVLSLTQMQWLGECLTRWQINSEIQDLRDDSPPGGKWFRFARYDMKLERPWLADELGVKLSDKEVVRLRGMDDPGTIEELYALAQLAAEKQVKREHFFPTQRTTAGPPTPKLSNAPG